jgi:hypothetical protein
LSAVPLVFTHFLLATALLDCFPEKENPSFCLVAIKIELPVSFMPFFRVPVKPFS